jgi:four helix bundle protein
MAGYRDLEVRQKSYALALEVYRATHSFPQHALFGLTSQLRRAAVSIPANVAEGHCRHTRADYLHFVAIARGSAGELETLISIAKDLSYLDASAERSLTEPLTSVRQMLTRLAQSLRGART